MGTVNVLEHEKWVERVVKKYVKKSHPHYEDILQEGMIALLEAARTFDETRGVKFLTYATPGIYQRVGRYLRRATAAVHVPDIRLAEDRATRGVPEPSHFDEASMALGNCAEDADCGSLRSLLRMPGMHTPASQEEQVASVEEKAILRREMKSLPVMHCKVLQHVGFDGLTLRQTAERTGIRHQRVYDLYVEAVGMIRARLGLPPIETRSGSDFEAA